MSKNDAIKLIHKTFTYKDDYQKRNILIHKINSLLYYNLNPIIDNYFYDINSDEEYFKDILKSTAFDVSKINPK